jgi:Holliday junction DNA helicase RuvA
MIGYLRGRLAAKNPPTLVIDVQGVGYECEAPMSTFYQLPDTGGEVTLRTHLVVREDAHVLYAFGSEDERRLFRHLLRVSGIGPKIGLAILSGLTVEQFLRSIEAEDTALLVRVPGVGRKTAERLLIELRDRVKEFGGAGSPQLPSRDRPADPQAEAFSALVALGYRPAEVTRLLSSVGAEVSGTEDLIRRALQAAAN